MRSSASPFRGQCHCGDVRFEVTLAAGLDKIVRCTCSYCRMKGSVMVFTDLDLLKFTIGQDVLTTYRFNTLEARHYFCSRCGVHVHHQRRFDPNQFAINVACLDGVSPFDFEAVPVLDGANHPLDHGGGPLKVIGTLRFERLIADKRT
ncbi:GFA family protein [Caulobacter sp. LARHSG274]